MNIESMSIPSFYSPPLADEQILYDFLLESVQSCSFEQVLEDMEQLFVEAKGFRKIDVFLALERIVRSKNSDHSFNNLFNRCCHILINHWQLQPQNQRAIPRFVNLLSKLSSKYGNQASSSARIRQLVIQFTQTEAFTRLQRIASIINGKQESSAGSVGNLIHRYPYLYDYCLLGDDSNNEHRQMVRRMKIQNERRYEINLSHYVTYRVRLAQSQKSGLLLPKTEMIQPAKNPTLLSDSQLNRSIKHFVGSVEQGHSYKALSQNFNNQIAYTPTFGSFKDDLYSYILGSLDEKYQQGQFNNKLYQLFQNTYPDSNHKRPTEFLIMRTSNHLLNFLIVENSQNPEHYVFVDLISNIGVTRTVGLLLKIVLFCNKVKPYLEKRFSVLFNHYESFTREGVPWLVKSLENMQVAFSLHFGRVDLSGLKSTKIGV